VIVAGIATPPSIASSTVAPARLTVPQSGNVSVSSTTCRPGRACRSRQVAQSDGRIGQRHCTRSARCCRRIRRAADRLVLAGSTSDEVVGRIEARRLRWRRDRGLLDAGGGRDAHAVCVPAVRIDVAVGVICAPRQRRDDLELHLRLARPRLDVSSSGFGTQSVSTIARSRVMGR
jgi:hypothetical protein